MGPLGWPETSARNYHCTLRNFREYRRSLLLPGGSVLNVRSWNYETPTYTLCRLKCWSFDVKLGGKCSEECDLKVKFKHLKNTDKICFKSSLMSSPVYEWQYSILQVKVWKHQNIFRIGKYYWGGPGERSRGPDSSHQSRLALSPIQPSVQWEQALFPG